MEPTTAIFFIAIFILSIVIHEVAHGYAADMLGDPTAKLAGRLTLNPIPHIDPIGSVLLPIVLVVSNAGLLFGWAKPVPYNPYNLRKGKWGPMIVAIAGPLSNIFVALVFGILIRFGPEIGLNDSFYFIFGMIVFVNILLAIFNMIPIPPLDGSKVLFSILPYKYQHIQQTLEQYGFMILLFFIFLGGWRIISPIINFLFQVITGINWY